MNELAVGHLFDWQDKNVVIAGADNIIGTTLAHAFAHYQANVILIDENEDSLQNMRQIISDMGRKCLAYGIDMTDEKQVSNTIADICEHFGTIDVLVNQVGINFHKPALSVERNGTDTVLDAEPRDMFLVAHEAGRVMVEQGYGKIIHTASDFSLNGHQEPASHVTNYDVILQMTKSLAYEYVSFGVNVNAVSRGRISNKDRLSGSPFGHIISKIPKHQFVEPSDLVGAYLFLASPGADYIAGQTLYVHDFSF